MSFPRGLALLVATALAAVAVPAVPVAAVPSDSVVASAVTLVVDSPGSVSQYRYAGGVRVQAAGLADDTTSVALLLDDVEVANPTVMAGTVDEHVTFPGITEGSHVVTLEQDGIELAAQTVEVTTDPFVTTASPSWITAETLESDGVTLSAEGLAPGIDVVGRIGDNAAEAEVDPEGRVSVRVRNDGDEFVSQPGLHPAGLEHADDRTHLSYTEVRVTVLDATTRGGGAEVVGTGFEPGSAVLLTVAGTDASTTGEADGTGTVVLAAPLGGRQEVTLSSAAGSVTRTLDLDVEGTDPPGGLTPNELAALEQELEQAVQDIEEIEEGAATVRAAIAALGPAGRGTLDLPDGFIERQVELQQRVIGAFPEPGLQKPPAGGEIQADLKAIEKEHERQVEDSRARYEQQLGEVQDEIQDAMEEMMKRIIEFLREMNESQLEQTRAIVRLSLPEVLSVGALPAGLVTVAVPATFTGRHHVATIDPMSGLVTAWQPFEVAAPGPGATVRSLPGIGAAVGPGLLGLAAAAVLAGAALVRSSRHPAR